MQILLVYKYKKKTETETAKQQIGKAEPEIF